MTRDEFTAAVSRVINAMEWGEPRALKRTRGASGWPGAFPYAPAVVTPGTPHPSVERIDGNYATEDSAIDVARGVIIERRRALRQKLHDPAQRELRRVHGLPLNLDWLTEGDAAP